MNIGFGFCFASRCVFRGLALALLLTLILDIPYFGSSIGFTRVGSLLCVEFWESKSKTVPDLGTTAVVELQIGIFRDNFPSITVLLETLVHLFILRDRPHALTSTKVRFLGRNTRGAKLEFWENV